MTATALFVLARALVYSALFIGLLLVALPARVLVWSGITPPAAVGPVEAVGIVVAVLGGALAVWCILTFVFVGRGTPAPMDRRAARGGRPYRGAEPHVPGGRTGALWRRALLSIDGSPGLRLLFLFVMHLFAALYEEPTLKASSATTIGLPAYGPALAATHESRRRACCSVIRPPGARHDPRRDPRPRSRARDAPTRAGRRPRTSSRRTQCPRRTTRPWTASRSTATSRPPARLRIVGSAPAGSLLGGAVEPGTAAKIFTGSIVPDGADTVVRVEDTSEADGVVTVTVPIKHAANVRKRGEDIMPGATVLRAGTLVGPADVGVLASVGRHRVVTRPPSRRDLHRRRAGRDRRDARSPRRCEQQRVGARRRRRTGGRVAIVLPIVRDRLRTSAGASRKPPTPTSSSPPAVCRSASTTSCATRSTPSGWRGASGRWRRSQEAAHVRHARPAALLRAAGKPRLGLVCFEVYVRPALKLAGHAAIHHAVVPARLAAPVKKATN
jgi:hypothetical protein